MRLLAFLLMFTMISCGDETAKVTAPSIDQTKILGYWDIDSAMRNGKETTTLTDSYIHFQGLNEVTTNIFGSEQTQAIVWNDNIAMVADSSMSYKINSVSIDSLQLSFSLQRHLFELSFLKKKLE